MNSFCVICRDTIVVTTPKDTILVVKKEGAAGFAGSTKANVANLQQNRGHLHQANRQLIQLLNPAPDNSGVVISCGHVFHKNCILEWFYYEEEEYEARMEEEEEDLPDVFGPSCPYCKKIVGFDPLRIYPLEGPNDSSEEDQKKREEQLKKKLADAEAKVALLQKTLDQQKRTSEKTIRNMTASNKQKVQKVEECGVEALKELNTEYHDCRAIFHKFLKVRGFNVPTMPMSPTMDNLVQKLKSMAVTSNVGSIGAVASNSTVSAISAGGQTVAQVAHSQDCGFNGTNNRLETKIPIPMEKSSSGLRRGDKVVWLDESRLGGHRTRQTHGGVVGIVKWLGINNSEQMAAVEFVAEIGNPDNLSASQLKYFNCTEKHGSLILCKQLVLQDDFLRAFGSGRFGPAH